MRNSKLPSNLVRRRVTAALAALAGAGLVSVSGLAHAAWPEKPIQLIVPFPAGSSPDILARMVSEPLSAELGQAIVVENKPGAGGNIGTRQATQAKPDGYTLLVTINGPIVTAPALYKNSLGYNPQKDLAPVTLIGTSPNVLVVPENFEAQNLQEFVSLAKKKPGELNYGSVGPGSSSHLAMAMLESEADIKLQQIPYTGFPQIITSIIAGDIQAGFMVPGIAMPQVKAGKVRALAITSLEPSPVLPGIPTMAEQGFPGFESISWNAVFAPAGTPDAIVQELNTRINKILSSDEIKQKMAALYFTPKPTTPQELGQMIVSEKGRWDAVIQRLGLSLD